MLANSVLVFLVLVDAVQQAGSQVLPGKETTPNQGSEQYSVINFEKNISNESYSNYVAASYDVFLFCSV